VDANQGEIVEALRAVGATVQSVAAVGKGCPDILIGWRGANFLAEIKDGKKPPSSRKLTPLESEWHKAWAGQVAIVKDVDEALALLD
jgi:hypothetical protein